MNTIKNNKCNVGCRKIALINVGFLPEIGGSYRALYEFFRRFPRNSISVLTSHQKGDQDFDRIQDFPIERDLFFTIMEHGGPIQFLYDLSNIRRNRIITTLNNFVFPHILVSKMAVKKTEEFVKKYNADILIPGQAWTSGFIGTELKRRLGMPFTTFIYGEDVSLLYEGPIITANPLISFPGYCRERFIKSIEEAEVVIANSKETASKAIGLNLNIKRLEIVYPGVDPELFRPDIETDHITKLLKINHHPIILSVGWLKTRKGFDRVVKVLPEIIKSFPNLLYIIRGKGPEKRNILTLAKKLGVQSHILFVDDLPYEYLPALYGLSDLFVMPNFTIPDTLEQEGFGMVFIEANCCGKPVIGGKSGGAIEAIKDGVTGFLIDSDSPDELTEKILFLLNNPEISKKIGLKGREIAIKNFSWEKLSKDIYEIILSIK